MREDVPQAVPSSEAFMEGGRSINGTLTLYKPYYLEAAVASVVLDGHVV